MSNIYKTNITNIQPNSYNQYRRKINLIKGWAEKLNRHLSEEKMQMSYIHIYVLYVYIYF